MPRGQSSGHRALAHLLAARSTATPKQAKEPILAIDVPFSVESQIMSNAYGCFLGIILFVLGIVGLIILVPDAIKDTSDLVHFTGDVTRYDCYEKRGHLTDCYIWIQVGDKTIRFKLPADSFNKREFDSDFSERMPLTVGILKQDYETLDTLNHAHYEPYEIKNANRDYLSTIQKSETLSRQFKIGIGFTVLLVLFGAYKVYQSVKDGL